MTNFWKKKSWPLHVLVSLSCLVLVVSAYFNNEETHDPSSNFNSPQQHFPNQDDPKINKEAYQKLIELLKSSNVNLLQFLNTYGSQYQSKYPPPPYYNAPPPPPPPSHQPPPVQFQRLYPQNTNQYDRYNHIPQPYTEPPVIQSPQFKQSNKYQSTSPSYGTKSREECGVMRPALGNYVSGGKSVRSDSWPWHIQLNIAGNSRNDSETYCGATLISKRFILTAAHCYDDLLPHKRARHTLIVAKGVEVSPQPKSNSYSRNKAPEIVKLRAQAVYLHPRYVPAMTESEARMKGS
jgi:hypothetical protein